jgi:hypothetical protein
MITPGFMYSMALLFSIFGTDVATARVAQAVVHAITAVALYFVCRRLGIRRALSGLAALAYVVVCQAAWPIVSQHWWSTMLCVLLLLVCVDLRRDRATATLLPGVVLGLLISVQHQRGTIMAAGIFVWLLLDARVGRRLAPQERSASLPARLACLVAGALLVVAPVLIAVIAKAGFQPVWRALVIFPLFDYRGSTYCPWGHVNIMTHTRGTYTFPRLLKYLPVILPVTAGRLAVLWVRRRSPQQAARLTLLLAFSLTSMLSIAYFPDFIHIAFIAPVFFAVIAETLEWLAHPVLDPARPLRIAAGVAAALLLVAAGYRLRSNFVRVHAAFPVIRTTAFGRIALPDQEQAELYDKVNELMRDVPSREIYCYPIISHLYLMTDSHNPTPYGFLIPGYSGPDLIQHVIEILRVKKLPYIVAVFLRPDDPIANYIRSEYEPLDDGSPAAKFIYRRKATS